MGIIMAWIMAWIVVYLYIISLACDIHPFCGITFVMTVSLVITFLISVAIGWIKLR